MKEEERFSRALNKRRDVDDSQTLSRPTFWRHFFMPHSGRTRPHVGFGNPIERYRGLSV